MHLPVLHLEHDDVVLRFNQRFNASVMDHSFSNYSDHEANGLLLQFGAVAACYVCSHEEL